MYELYELYELYERRMLAKSVAGRRAICIARAIKRTQPCASVNSRWYWS